MNGKGKGKRSREQTNKGSSGVTPPEKRTSRAVRKKNNTIQTTISEWVMDDDDIQSRLTHDHINNEHIEPTTPSTSHPLTANTPHISELPISQLPNMLSPIMSQQRANEGRKNTAHDSNTNSPISDALNLAASAASLRKDFATCERIMTEKHQFIVAMLDGMSTTVSTIADKLESLETRVKVLEETEDTKTIIAQNIFSAANERYLGMEAKVRDCTSVINTLKQKCTKIDDLTARVQIMDKQISERKEAQIPLYTSNEKLDIAIYGLNTYNDVTTSVNRLFKDMNLGNTECISAYRTPTRPGMSRPGVVIAEMRCLRDKRAVLERKRYIRHMPQYQHVFVKASKSHTEQVIDANFNIMLNKMTNGDTYYVSDNGRIRKKTGYSRDDVRYTDQSQRSLNNGDHYEHYQAYGGARPKSTQSYGHGPTYGNRNNDYGRTRVSTHPSSHTRYGDITRRQKARRQSSDGRPPSDLYNYDHYNER